MTNPPARLWTSSRRNRALFPLPSVTRSARPSVFNAPALSQTRRRKARPRVVELRPELLPKPPAPKQSVLIGLEDFVPPPAPDDGYLRQRVLHNVPPAPQRRQRVLPLALITMREWVGQRVNEGAVDAAEARRVYFRVREMRHGDALWCGEYRLEWCWLRHGLPHYRLFCGVYLLGCVDVPLERDGTYLRGVDAAQDDDRFLVAGADLPRIQRLLAAHLVAYGWSADACALDIGGQRTGHQASKRGVYRLFRLGGASDEGDED